MPNLYSLSKLTQDSVFSWFGCQVLDKLLISPLKTWNNLVVKEIWDVDGSTLCNSMELGCD